MKLALVGPTYPYRGGIAHYTTLLYRELVAHRHQVLLYSFKRQYPPLLFPGRTDREPGVLKLDVRCEYALDSLNPFTWWTMARSIRAQRPDVLVLQWWVPFFAPMWILLAQVARQAGIRVTFICHNVLPHERRPWDSWLARWTLGLGDGFVVQSQDEKTRLLALLPGRSVQVMPIPIFDIFSEQPIPQDKARQRLGLPQRAPVLIFFGFVREYKGLRYLLDAMPVVRAALADVRLLIVGEFWQDKQTYLDQIERLDLERSVVIVDRYVPNEEVPMYFSAADVVVLPYTHVTQSAVVQLAFGLGVPVITTRIGGLPDVVSDGETGLLVPPGDPAALAEAVKRYFHEGWGSRMAEAIYQARAQFSWDKMVTLIEGLAA